MARLPQVREIAETIIGAATPPMKALLQKLNPFMRDVVNALDGRLTVSENLAQCWADVRYKEGSGPLLVTLPALKGKEPYGVTVEGVTVSSGALAGAVGVDWERAAARNGSAIRLRAVYGLGAGASVTLRLLVKAE